MDAPKVAFAAVKDTFGHLVVGLQQLDWTALPHSVKEHMKNNPKMSAVQILSLILLAIPGLVVAPALGALGFSSIGPVAGSAAAAYQSAHGVTAAFSTLQSAAMGGYGVVAVNSMVQGCSAAVTLVTGFLGFHKGKNGDHRPALKNSLK